MIGWIMAVAIGIGAYVYLRYAVGRDRLREHFGMSPTSTSLPRSVIVALVTGAINMSVLAAIFGDWGLVIVAVLSWLAVGSLLFRFVRRGQ